jgi:low affinity Fe/Cu permease
LATVINTGKTIVTFLMVFLIQQSQNKDSVVLHLKLSELLSSHRSADNHLIGIEDASEEELRRLAAAYLRLSTTNPSDDDIRQKTADLHARSRKMPTVEEAFDQGG